MKRSILITFLSSTALGFYVLGCDDMDSNPSGGEGTDSLDFLSDDIAPLLVGGDNV